MSFSVIMVLPDKWRHLNFPFPFNFQMFTHCSLFIELFTKANTCSTLSASSTVLQSFTLSQLVSGLWTNLSLPSLSKWIFLNARIIRFTLQWSTFKRKRTLLLQNHDQNTNTHTLYRSLLWALLWASPQLYSWLIALRIFLQTPKSPSLSQYTV